VFNLFTGAPVGAAAGDYVELGIYSDVAGNCTGGAENMWLSIERAG
jgi:hypothetical protein